MPRKAEELTDVQKSYILLNAEGMNAAELSAGTGLTVGVLKHYCFKNGITYKKKTYRILTKAIGRLSVSKEPGKEIIRFTKPSFQRPTADYSNHSPYGLATELMKNK